MSDFEIDFENPIAKYELRPATIKKVSKEDREREAAEHREKLRNLFGAEEFEKRERRWAAEEAAKDPREHWLYGVPESELPLYLGSIVAIGEEKNHRPKAQTMELAVKALVECKETPFYAVALKVARAVGAVYGADVFRPPGGERVGEPVSVWSSLAIELRHMFEGRLVSAFGKEYRWPDPAAQDKGELKFLLVPDKNNKPVLALRPHDIRDALKLYAARMIATGTTFNICENCKAPFLSGGTRFHNKRGDARFCSNDCRWKWHNEARRKAR